MSNGQESINSRQLLERLAREGLQKEREVSIVTSPGARESGWAVKVKSHSSYNVYNVITVEIGSPGSVPVEIGQQMQAVNLAESFLQEGTLSAGIYAVMLRVGDKNVFYVEP
ncbi:MAG: hypothetical protein AMJ75_00660 [Phycisphaerae bacterium SM1_79]|nr:MAG: hypothetical protein AMJ75_00660 [Phycisphaerae bacterium SM1_79]